VNNLNITNPLMKTTIAQLVIAAVSLVIVSCGGEDHDAAKATPAQGSILVVFNESVSWDSSFALWSTCLGNGGADDTITVVSGPLGRLASFTISPELATETLDNRVDMASADDELVATMKLLKGMADGRGESVSLPRLLTLVRENITSDTRKVVITASTLNHDREEPAFSFNEGKYPSDGHLKASINESPFATQGDELSNVSVVWNDTAVAGDFMNDIHRLSVRRFVTAWVQNQGASIQFGTLTTERPVVLDSQDSSVVVMRVAATRFAPVVVSQPNKPVAPQPAQAPKQSEAIRDSLREQNEASLEINFDLDSATINEESTPLLRSAATAISDKDYELRNFVVEGHTSPEGAAQHNQLLSEKRAASVRDALIRYGVDANRLTGIGYGSSRPLYVGAQEASRSANRRVVLRMVDPNVAERN